MLIGIVERLLQRGDGVSSGGADAGRKLAVKEKVLPRPGSLCNAMRPPISSTSRVQMVRPRPVPPNLRVVEPSAWRKASKTVF